MAGLTIQIDGLEDIRKALDSKTISKKLVPAIGLAVNNLHKELKSAVSLNYAYTRNNLDHVLLGKSTSQVTQGENFIDFGLVYVYQPIPLSDFPNKTSEITIPTIRFFIRDRLTGKIIRITKNKAIATSVQVKRNGGFKTVVGNKGFGGFKAKIRGKVQISEREQQATWLKLDVRAPYYQLFGPSLSQMATTMYDTNAKVQAVKDELPDKIASFLEL